MKSTIRAGHRAAQALRTPPAGCQAPAYSPYQVGNPYYPEAAMERMGQDFEYEFYRNMQLRAPDYL